MFGASGRRLIKHARGACLAGGVHVSEEGNSQERRKQHGGEMKRCTRGRTAVGYACWHACRHSCGVGTAASRWRWLWGRTRAASAAGDRVAVGGVAGKHRRIDARGQGHLCSSAGCHVRVCKTGCSACNLRARACSVACGAYQAVAHANHVAASCNGAPIELSVAGVGPPLST